MNLLRSFPLFAYALALVAIISFCVAKGQIPFLLVTGTIASLSWYITEGPRGLALPRWVANVLIIVASLAMVPDLLAHRQDVVGVLGRFTVWLLLIKLYERKSRRDYGQLMWLTAVLMVAGTLEARSLLFGVALVIYSVLGVYVLLLFQLFAAQEAARDERMEGAPTFARLIPPLRPVLGRQVRRQFTSLCAVVGVVGVLTAVAVFLFLPRGVGAGVLNQLTEIAQNRKTGFVNQIDLTGAVGNRITDSRAPVLRAYVRNAGGMGVQLPGGLYLRGAALERYHPDEHIWTTGSSRRGRTMAGTAGGATGERGVFGRFQTNNAAQDAIGRAYQLEIVPVTPIGTVGFTAMWPLALSSTVEQRFLFDQRTQVLQLPNNAARAAPYTVWFDPLPQDATISAITGSSVMVRDKYRNVRLREEVERILARADIPPLAEAPVTYPERGRYHRRVAQAVSDSFLSGFQYTLDLGDVRIEGDPIEAFVFDFKRGHCEFFASAMAAMLQSAEIDARVISGFLASDYVSDGEYLVRESNAHAWVEVRTSVAGWATFDPTPPAALEAIHAQEGTLADRMQAIYETIEVEWMQNVVEYNQAAQEDLQTSLNMESLAWVDEVVAGVDDWVVDVYDRFGLLGAVQIVVVSAAVVVAGLIVVRLVRRARRIRQQLRLGHLSGQAYRRMLAQLGFYIDMLDVLHRAGVHKPEWQPPLAFAASLADIRPAIVEPITRLSELFYSARYGGRELSAADKEDAQRRVRELAEKLRVRV